jgi:hypothetical protein
MGEAIGCVGNRESMGTLYLSLYFALNLKLLQNIKVFKKN